MGLTAIGILGGILLGSLVTLWYQHHGLDISKEVELLGQFGISGLIYPRLSLLSMTIGPMMVFFFTFLAALYPALRLRRLSPVAALGSV
jgi:ABC-type lipoprotein release transport system permease subunit